MDACVMGSECFDNLDGTSVRVEVFESINKLFDPDEIGKGNRVACTPLKPGLYHGVSSMILYATAGEKHLRRCITVFDHQDNDKKKCKLKELWEVDEDNVRLEIDEIAAI